MIAGHQRMVELSPEGVFFFVCVAVGRCDEAVKLEPCSVTKLIRSLVTSLGHWLVLAPPTPD